MKAEVNYDEGMWNEGETNDAIASEWIITGEDRVLSYIELFYIPFPERIPMAPLSPSPERERERGSAFHGEGKRYLSVFYLFQ